jgi:hypothetical protein
MMYHAIMVKEDLEFLTGSMTVRKNAGGIDMPEQIEV